MMPARKVCFFVTPIGAANSPERKRADDIKRYILNDALAGKFKVLRADELPQPGSITHQVIKMLYAADLVIADLTGQNPNVVYELAVRHAFNKLSIHLIDYQQRIPFDLQDERTILFNLSDVRSVDDCKQELRKIIKVISQKKFKYSSPVFRVLGVEAATEEEREGFLETIADQIETMASDMSSIESQMGSIETDLSGVNFDKMGKQVADLSRDVYDIKLDVKNILEKNK